MLKVSDRWLKSRGITCFLRYEIDPAKLEEFADYAERWVRLVDRFGGSHRGYFLPGEGDSDVALALFDFPDLATYEKYRMASFEDPECIEAFEFAKKTQCFRKYERSFFHPFCVD